MAGDQADWMCGYAIGRRCYRRTCECIFTLDMSKDALLGCPMDETHALTLMR